MTNGNTQATASINEAQRPNRIKRKIRKLKNDPKLFLKDSKAYVGARKTLYFTWAKLGSFALVVLASLFVIGYYGIVASPRYASQAQFVVKQAGANELSITGLAAIGSASPSTRDALIVQEYIQSIEMAQALDQELGLKAHYENTEWDWISRLAVDSTQEDYLNYFQQHITVEYNELSEILRIEVQAFTADFALQLATELIKISEQFINQLGIGMANSQLQYAEQEVSRTHDLLKQQQLKLIDFQNTYQLLSPDSQSGALVAAVNNLEAEIVAQETELKSLKAFMRKDAAEVKALEFRIAALRSQLTEEKAKLTSSDQNSLNKVAADFKAIELNTKLSGDLYASALTSLELVRAEAFTKLKYLLIVEQPRLAEEDSYPRRLYNIATWFVVLVLLYLVGRLTIAVIKEHRD